MTINRRSAIGLLLAAIAGCDPAPPKVTPGPETPHGGSLFPLPDGQGYVEILKQAAPGAQKQSQLVAYFLDSNRKPLATNPTTASLTLSTGATSPVAFKPADNSDPARAGGLVSDPIPDRDDLGGDLTATVAGKSIVVPISIR